MRAAPPLPRCCGTFCYTFPYLPLRPGVYSWRAVIYEATEPVDDWECLPQMQVATVPVTHYRDEPAGILNIPSKLEVVPRDVTPESSAHAT